MIQIVSGPKGYGKTKIMIDGVNSAVKEAKGNVVFITDKTISTVSIDFNVRCLYTEENKIFDAKMFIGFLKGLIAGNSDIEYIYIDGLKRILGDSFDCGEEVFNALEDLQKENASLKFVISITGTKDDLPEYVVKYIK